MPAVTANDEKMKKVIILDYGVGNLFSVYHACTTIGVHPIISNSPKEIMHADYLILPGVGAFGDAMNTLEKLDLIAVIKDFIATGKPFLGVCLGLQLLFTESEEFGIHKGLGIIDGVVKRFPSIDKRGQRVKVPQIEWNQIFSRNEKVWKRSPLKLCNDGDFMYFVHSYYVIPEKEDDLASSTEYGGVTYCSSIIRKNIFATQFHPEKSGKHGLKIYKSFLEHNET